MICPKCKKEIPEKSLKCHFCDARIASLCNKCSAYNSIYNLKCVNCNNDLLKVCPSCKSINLPSVLKCRKCDFFFKREEIPSNQNPQINQETFENNNDTLEKNSQNEEIDESQSAEATSINYNAALFAQQQAKELLKDALNSNDKKIISVSGEKGVGKTLVLKSAIAEVEKDERIWLLGSCSPITQLSPCGLIQDILLTFFNIPSFCTDNLQLKKDSQKFFHSEFPSLTNEEIFKLLNFLYPINSDYFENILYNKDKTFEFLKKVFKTVLETNKIVLVIENFEFIDGMSYEFLHNLLKDDLVLSQMKFVVTYNEVRPVRGFLHNQKIKGKAYFDIALNTFDKNQITSFVDRFFEPEICPSATKNKLYSTAGGNPAVLEQYLGLINDFKQENNSFGVELPRSVTDVIKNRLQYLKKDEFSYAAVSLAAIQGIKFSPQIINQVLKLNQDEFAKVLVKLQNLNFIVPVNANTYEFKNTLLWSEIVEIIKQDESFIEFNKKLFEIYSKYVLSSHSIIAIVAQNLDEDADAFNYWTNNIKLAAFIGDTNLYAISQKQCLSLLERVDTTRNELIKNNIYERLGKLLSKSNSQEAMEYLPNAIKNANRNENILKEIELTGYLTQCCVNLGNYHGAMECIDAVIERIDAEFELELAMLKSRKLEPLLNIGNSGEIVHLVDNEIFPVFDKYLNAKPHKNITRKALYKAWLQTYLNLANALIFQGNNRSFEVLTTLFDLFEKNEFDDKLFICKAKLSQAFAYTIKGEIEFSERTLGEILTNYKTDIMDSESISRWNLINIINNYLQKNYEGMKEELFQVVTFANNINDNFTKNILKTFLGKLFKDEQNAKQALEIYSQQITYFSKEKNAIGALLCWFFIAEAKLITEGPLSAIEVAQKALDVAQSPKINNYFFVVLYSKIIAEAHMIKGEYDYAKVFIEKAILVAKKFELLTLLADLYLLYGKYLQDLAITKENSSAESQIETKEEYVEGASKMFKKATAIAQNIKNQYLIMKSQKAKNVLNSFCQLNSITLN